MLFSLSAVASIVVLTSQMLGDNFAGVSFTPKIVILFKFVSLVADDERTAVLDLLILLFGSPVADFDRELIT